MKRGSRRRPLLDPFTNLSSHVINGRRASSTGQWSSPCLSIGTIRSGLVRLQHRILLRSIVECPYRLPALRTSVSWCRRTSWTYKRHRQKWKRWAKIIIVPWNFFGHCPPIVRLSSSYRTREEESSSWIDRITERRWTPSSMIHSHFIALIPAPLCSQKRDWPII